MISTSAFGSTVARSICPTGSTKNSVKSRLRHCVSENFCIALQQKGVVNEFGLFRTSHSQRRYTKWISVVVSHALYADIMHSVKPLLSTVYVLYVFCTLKIRIFFQ